MKIIKIYTGSDNKSHFEEMDMGFATTEKLGNYSKKYPAKGIMFRDFKKGAVFDWHPAPQEQYIIYLEGEVEVEASDGEKRVFKPGDVLLAADTSGKGHITKTLSDGRSIIITTKE